MIQLDMQISTEVGTFCMNMSHIDSVVSGFPRTLAQAQVLNSACDLDVVISLNVPFETLKERLRHRWIHPASGRVYNLVFNPPRVKVREGLCVVLSVG